MFLIQYFKSSLGYYFWCIFKKQKYIKFTMASIKKLFTVWKPIRLLTTSSCNPFLIYHKIKILSSFWLSLVTTGWRRQWQPTPVFLPGESQGQRSLVGCCLWEYRVGHNWSDLAAAAAAAVTTATSDQWVVSRYVPPVGQNINS